MIRRTDAWRFFLSPYALAGAATAFATILYLTGATPWPLIVVAFAEAALACCARLGLVAGLASAVILTWWITLVAAMFARTLSVPLEITFAVAFASVSIGSLVSLSRSDGIARLRNGLRGPSRPWLLVATGPLLWLAGEAVAASVSRWGFVSWAMAGDSANNVLFAREVVGAGGVQAWGEGNVTPFPYALLAAPMAPGRGDAASTLVSNNLSAYALTWRLLILLSCILAGSLAYALANRVHGATRRSTAIAGCVGSALPLTWFVTGYPLAFGFFNAHVALPLAIVALLAYVGCSTRPSLLLVLLAADATLILATWSPLVVVPGVLGLTVLVRERRHLAKASRRARWLVGLSLAQAATYFLATELPILLNSSSLLGVTGAFTAFPKWGIPILVVTSLAAAAILYRRDSPGLWWGLLALSIGLAVGLLGVLALGGRGLTDWQYYAHKYAWQGEVILLVVLVGMVPAMIHRMRWRWARVSSGGAGVLGVVILFGGLAPIVPPLPRTLDQGDPAPIALVDLAATGDHDALPDLVASLADDDEVRVLWRSDDALEYSADFWSLELLAGDLSGSISAEHLFDLRVIAYRASHDRVEDLCDLHRLTGLPVVALTRDGDLSEAIEDACGDAAVRAILMD